MLDTKADANAGTFSRVQARSAKFAALTTTASPSAMMMKPAQRSAMWPPSTVQASTGDGPRAGIQNRAAGAIYSTASATTHRTSRDDPAVTPPRIQYTAESD